eukprot:4170560-Prymnesium_polylepis.1
MRLPMNSLTLRMKLSNLLAATETRYARRTVPNIPAPPVDDPAPLPSSGCRGHRRGPTEGGSCTRGAARFVRGVGRGRRCAYTARHNCGAPAACEQIPIFGTP